MGPAHQARLETAREVEMSDHLGYDKRDPVAATVAAPATVCGIRSAISDINRANQPLGQTPRPQFRPADPAPISQIPAPPIRLGTPPQVIILLTGTRDTPLADWGIRPYPRSRPMHQAGLLTDRNSH